MMKIATRVPVQVLRAQNMMGRLHISSINVIRPLIKSTRRKYQKVPFVPEQLERRDPLSPLLIMVALILPIYATFEYFTRSDPKTVVPTLITEMEDIIEEINKWQEEYHKILLEEDKEDFRRVDIIGGAFAQLDDDGMPTDNSYLVMMTQKQLQLEQLYRRLLDHTNKLRHKILALESLCSYCNRFFNITINHNR